MAISRHWVGLAGFVLLLGAPTLARATTPDAKVRGELAGVRVPFIANEGQVDGRVAYYARTFAGTLFVTRHGELVYSLPGSVARDGAPPLKLRSPRGPQPPKSGWTLTETFRGGKAKPVAQTPSTTRVSSFLGNDPARWREQLRTYDEVGLGEVWPGVNVALRARGRSVEKVFTVAPGASVDRIRIRVAGARRLLVDDNGALVARTGPGNVTLTAPIAYQERDGVRQVVPVAYRVRGRGYRFVVGAYDRSRPLVIDPFLHSRLIRQPAMSTSRA